MTVKWIRYWAFLRKTLIELPEEMARQQAEMVLWEAVYARVFGEIPWVKVK